MGGKIEHIWWVWAQNQDINIRPHTRFQVEVVAQLQPLCYNGQQAAGKTGGWQCEAPVSINSQLLLVYCKLFGGPGWVEPQEQIHFCWTD